MRALLSLSIALSLTGSARAQCSSFQPAYPGLNGPVRALASWTPAGSTTPRLIAGGSFTWNQGQGSQDYIAQWNGSAWDGLGWGTDGPVNAITTWNRGSGQELIIGGDFTAVGSDSTGQLTANHIARWDGQSWHPLGTGADGPVDALITWDPDGDGPLPPELVAAGRFTHIGGVWSGGVAHWDGTSWHSFGWGIDGSGAALTVWDPDGPGPQIPNLVVGGSFPHAGANTTGQIDANNIARWNGVAWTALGSGLDPVHYLEAAAIGGQFGTNTAIFAGTSSDIEAWDGSRWQSLNAPSGRPIIWDPDGDGPASSQLLTSTFSVSYYCQWIKGQPKIWVEQDLDNLWLYGGPQPGWSFFLWHGGNPITATMTWDPDGPGPLQTELVEAADGQVGRVYRFTPPVIVSQPRGGTAHLGSDLSLSVSALYPATYQWYQALGPGAQSNWDNAIMDGLYPDGSLITGSTTSTLVISHVGPSQSILSAPPPYPLLARFYCRVSNSCGTTSTDTVAFRISACSSDFNHDGHRGTDADIEAFFRCIAGDCCPTCDYPDFNGDGDSGTDADIESFFRVLAGGPC